MSTSKNFIVSKSWGDLLGYNTTNCLVDGRYISRRLGPDEYKVLMACDNHQQALEIMQAWLDEINSKLT